MRTVGVIFFCVCSIIPCYAETDKAIFKQAQKQYVLGQYTDAEKLYTELLNPKYRYYDVCVSLGDIALKQKRWADSRIYFLEARTYAHTVLKKAMLTNCVADAYIAECRWADAADMLKESLLFVDDSNTYLRLGFVYRSIGLFDQAKASYERAYALDPHNQYVWQELGRIYEEDQEFEKAEKCYQEMLNQNEQDVFAQYRIAYILSRTGKVHEAYSTMRQLMQMSLNSEYITFFADLAYSEGYYKEAQNAYRKAMLMDPDDERNYIGLIWTYIEQNNRKALIAFFRALENTKKIEPDMYIFLMQYAGKKLQSKEIMNMVPETQVSGFYAQATNALTINLAKEKTLK